MFASSYISLTEDNGLPPDANPFANDLPPWVDGARQPEHPVPTPRTITFVAAGEPHHEEVNGEEHDGSNGAGGSDKSANGTQPVPVAINDAPTPAYAAVAGPGGEGAVHEAGGTAQDVAPVLDPLQAAASEDDLFAPSPDAEAVSLPGRRGGERQLVITFRRSGNLERDKYRLKEIYERVRDPRGRDRFVIRIISNGQAADLSFPNDRCTVSDVLTSELVKHFKVEVTVHDDSSG